MHAKYDDQPKLIQYRKSIHRVEKKGRKKERSARITEPIDELSNSNLSVLHISQGYPFGYDSIKPSSLCRLTHPCGHMVYTHRHLHIPTDIQTSLCWRKSTQTPSIWSPMLIAREAKGRNWAACGAGELVWESRGVISCELRDETYIGVGGLTATLTVNLLDPTHASPHTHTDS